MTSISFLQHSKAGFETGKKRIILQGSWKPKVDEENVNVALAEIQLGQFNLQFSKKSQNNHKLW